MSDTPPETPAPEPPPLAQVDPPLPVPAERPPPPTRARRAALTRSAALGALYAIVIYALFHKYNVLPTMAFLFLVPTAIGAVPQLFTDEDQIHLFDQLLLSPVLSLMGFLVLAALVFREAVVCMLVLSAPFLAIGFLSATLIWAWQARKLALAKRKKAALLLAFLPLIWAPVERAFFMPEEAHVEVSQVEIAAPPRTVFDHLATVETMAPGEYPASLWDTLGVPRPIRATCPRPGPGAARTGEFEFGLRFDEVITRWVPDREMAFSVSVDPRTLREGSAERHAFEVGYFRFTEAAYTLTPTPTGTRLTLSSRYILKSGWNSYGHRWSHALVTDFQDRVLAVLARRIERDQRNLAGRH